MNRNRPGTGNDRAAQNAQTLKALVKLESNKVCADCKRNKHPRWASWNLGVFVCIRCSGIHRGLGTHISRVKSVDLDAWTDEQLQSILKWGNARANKYWEAKLQPGHVPSESKIENFIRTKYESKRWVMDGPMPDPATLGDDDDVPLNVVQEKAKIERSASLKQTGNLQRPPQATNQVAAPKANVNLFDDDFEPPARPSTTDVPSRPPPQAAPAAKPAAQSSNLMGLDFFGAPQPAGVGRPSSAAANPTPAANTRNDLKSSILSLYASAPKSQPVPQPTHDAQPSFGGSFGAMASPTAPKSDAFGGLSDAFGGLNFSSQPATNVRSPPVQSPTSAFGFPSTSAQPPPPQQPQSSAFSGLSFPTAKAAPSAAQVTSPPPLSGGDFFSSTATKPSASKPAAAPQANNLNFSFTQSQSPPPPKPSTTSIPADLFGDDGFSSFSSAPMKSPTSPPKMPSPPVQSPPAFSSAFNLSSPTITAPKPAPAAQPTRPTVVAQSSASMFDPWGGADTNAWGAPEPAKPVAPKVELGSVPSRITPNDISGGWGAPISNANPTANKPVRQASVTADEDFGGWASATPATSKPAAGFGASDPFDNPWG